MNKKIICNTICLIMFVSILSIGSGSENLVELLDQQQPVSNGKIFTGTTQAQSFKPILDNLSKIEICVKKMENPMGILRISIRKSLTETDLTSAYIPANSIPSSDWMGCWVEFDFPDIEIIPEETYYIIFYFDNIFWNESNHIRWNNYGNLNSNDAYNRGIPYVYRSGIGWRELEETWENASKNDFCFKTYGHRDNYSPSMPIISGPTKVKIGVEYEYNFSSTDPDGDDIYYCIDWGDDSTEISIGPYQHIIEQSANYTWHEQKTNTIRIKARDIYQAESDWATLEIYISKNKIYLQNILEKYPILTWNHITCIWVI